MKTCNKCNIEKEFIDFYKKNRINCIECIKKEKIENKKIKIQS